MKSKLQKKHIIFVVASFLLISLYAALKLNVFMLLDVPYSFRSDNFWSYTSLIFRRGMTGEFIYRVDLLTGAGPQIYATLIWFFYTLFLFLLLNQVLAELSVIDCYLFLLSPMFLIYGVDSEIFMLIPFLGLYCRNESIRVFSTLLLIILATLIREMSFLFYFPVLICFIMNDNKLFQLSSFAVLILLILVLMFPKPPANFGLEISYWSEKGIQLQSTNLYKFVDVSLQEVILKHADYIYGNLKLIFIPVVFFIFYMVATFYLRTGSLIGSLYCLLMVNVCFILTVDYGRYFYIFIIYIFLASSENMSKYFSTYPSGPGSASLHFFKIILERIKKYRTLILFILVISPSGYWSMDYENKPRFYTLFHDKCIKEIFEKRASQINVKACRVIGSI